MVIHRRKRRADRAKVEDALPRRLQSERWQDRLVLSFHCYLMILVSVVVDGRLSWRGRL
jgi:hypothetical protein